MTKTTISDDMARKVVQVLLVGLAEKNEGTLTAQEVDDSLDIIERAFDFNRGAVRAEIYRRMVVK
jgi:hypothetical protein